LRVAFDRRRQARLNWPDHLLVKHFRRDPVRQSINQRVVGHATGIVDANSRPAGFDFAWADKLQPLDPEVENILVWRDGFLRLAAASRQSQYCDYQSH